MASISARGPLWWGALGGPMQAPRSLEEPTMKSSVALLAGLLAGLALGGMDVAQPLPTTLTATALAQEDGFEQEKNPKQLAKKALKGASGKQTKCIYDCQAPVQRCQKRCGKGEDACVNKCVQGYMKCMKGCGADLNKFVPEEGGKKRK
jgi:hypothetical protein